MIKTGKIILGCLLALWLISATVHEGFVVQGYIHSALNPLPSGSVYFGSTASIKEHYVSTLIEPPEVPPPSDHPPLRVVIGADIWTIHYSTKIAFEKRGCIGFENNDTHKIWLPRTINVEDPREDLLHEILHAVLNESRQGLYAKYNEDENSFVEPMAPQLLQVLQDNPTLVKWLERKP